MKLNLLGKVFLGAVAANVGVRVVNHLLENDEPFAEPVPAAPVADPWNGLDMIFWKLACAGRWYDFFSKCVNGGMKPGKADDLYKLCRTSLRERGYEVV